MEQPSQNVSGAVGQVEGGGLAVAEVEECVATGDVDEVFRPGGGGSLDDPATILRGQGVLLDDLTRPGDR